MKSILIIEDEKELAELLAFHLEKEGYRASIALDGASGLEAATEASPDLVLLDVMIPRMNGFEVCRLLKGNLQTARIPILMLTARGEEVDRVVGFEVGADDYVVKPFSENGLSYASIKNRNGNFVEPSIQIYHCRRCRCEEHAGGLPGVSGQPAG